MSKSGADKIRRIIICEGCRAPFFDESRATGQEKRYCSRPCHKKSMAESLEAICPVCKDTCGFNTEDGGMIFCSFTCSDLFNWSDFSEYKIDYSVAKVCRNCKFCEVSSGYEICAASAALACKPSGPSGGKRWEPALNV